ncbi:MAG: AAA family ATPase [Hyphomicrobium aestuarii]|nr:AAA family ATPase [Hyphomicrobium aestuarii]
MTEFEASTTSAIDRKFFRFRLPGPNGAQAMEVASGASLIFVGPNGGGKTRLAVFIEELLGPSAHRISAHRALSLNPSVPKISERSALAGLRTGYAADDIQIHYRYSHRWQQNSATSLLSDFDYLVQALFAEQSNRSLLTHRDRRSGSLAEALPTKMERLVEIWQRLLPHRELHVTGDNIEVSITGSDAKYPASQMSDGERSVFYMIGQALVAADESVLIVDEPELHVHRSIMSKLWDELESARSDCAFIFITHELEFAAGRLAQKYSIQDYNPTPYWKLEAVPRNTGFDEAVATLILGSRRPILFVEGTYSSLDTSIYRCCFPGWTVLPRGSCESVIHSVVTMRANGDLTRITCSGLVDADGFADAEKQFMVSRGIETLPVSEIENLVLLPSVSQAIAETEGHSGSGLQRCLDDLANEVFSSISADLIEEAVVRHCTRRIDRVLKRVDFGEVKSVSEVVRQTTGQLAALNVLSIADKARSDIQNAVTQQDLLKLLACYDNKGLFAIAARHLRRTRADDFKSWLVRVLWSQKAPLVLTAIRKALPNLMPR